MADFPAGIRCSSLALVAGTFPAVSQRSQAGNLLEVQSMNRAAGARISLSFRGITRSELLTLRQHYEGEGQFRSWLLSAVLLDGAEFASEISGMRWRYAAEPRAKDITDDVHDIEMELEHVPTTAWVERYVATAAPATVIVGSSVRLVGPDEPPALWVSRLTTAGSTSGINDATGNISIGPDGVNFQAFWFYASGESSPRVVVVKRDRGGVILWQRWSTTFGNSVTARDSQPPCVLALADGGCVLAAQDQSVINSLLTTRTMRVWRLQSDGDTEWGKDLSIVASGPKQMAINGADLLIGTEALSRGVAPTTSSIVTGPALIRMNASTGDLIGVRVFKVDSDNSSGYVFRQMLPKSNGRILLAVTRFDGRTTAPTQFLVEVSADLTTTHVAYGYGIANVDRSFTRCMAPLPDGGLLLVGQGGTGIALGFLRLNSSYQVLNHYVPVQNAGGQQSAGYFVELFPMALATDSNGGGCFLRDTFASNYLNAGGGAGALRFGDNGSSLASWSEVAEGSGIGSIRLMEAANPQMLDLTGRRGVSHIAGSNELATCRVTAIGFDLVQPTSTAAFGTAAATLNTGSCSNTMSVRGWEPAPGTVDVGVTVTRTTSSAPNGSITCTAANAAISLSDSSGSLSWDRKVLIA